MQNPEREYKLIANTSKNYEVEKLVGGVYREYIAGSDNKTVCLYPDPKSMYTIRVPWCDVERASVFKDKNGSRLYNGAVIYQEGDEAASFVVIGEYILRIDGFQIPVLCCAFEPGIESEDQSFVHLTKEDLKTFILGEKNA